LQDLARSFSHSNLKNLFRFWLH